MSPISAETNSASRMASQPWLASPDRKLRAAHVAVLTTVTRSDFGSHLGHKLAAYDALKIKLCRWRASAPHILSPRRRSHEHLHWCRCDHHRCRSAAPTRETTWVLTDFLA